MLPNNFVYIDTYMHVRCICYLHYIRDCYAVVYVYTEFLIHMENERQENKKKTESFQNRFEPHKREI